MAWLLEHVSRDSNEKADALAAMVTSLLIKETVLLPVYYQPKSSITTNQVNKIDEACPSWMAPIVRYLSLENRWITEPKSTRSRSRWLGSPL